MNALDKAALRALLLHQRQNVSHRGVKENQIAHNLTALLAPSPPPVLGLYYPIQGEVNLSPFWQTWQGPMAMPTVTQKHLVFRLWHSGDPLTAGPFGIPEPLPTAQTVIPHTLLVPCVGVDTAGHRLGYGRGYYDRYLAAHPDIHSIGVIFAVQQVPALPAEPHDQRLGAMVMEG
ncbi:MAG: 5-formyltetrahydrofolate cyclo-ligase [Alphaproteobacteria bacterium]